MASRVLPVIVEEWQFACCGDPFAVGDLVHWRLSFAEDECTLDEARVMVDAVTGGRVDSEHGRSGSLLSVQRGTAAGVTAFGPARPAGTAVRLMGEFAEDHHGFVPDAVPPTTGRITRVREARVGYETRGRVPVASRWELWDVQGFADRTVDTGEGSTGTPLFLVDLQLAGTDPG